MIVLCSFVFLCAFTISNPLFSVKSTTFPGPPSRKFIPFPITFFTTFAWHEFLITSPPLLLNWTPMISVTNSFKVLDFHTIWSSWTWTLVVERCNNKKIIYRKEKKNFLVPITCFSQFAKLVLRASRNACTIDSVTIPIQRPFNFRCTTKAKTTPTGTPTR